MCPDSIGDPRRKYPIPLRLRNNLIAKEDGGSKGYRGAGFSTMKKKILKRQRNRSSIAAVPPDVELMVDHIIPYRIGGLTPHTNEATNLRITDARNNFAVDNATGFGEKKIKRRLPKF